MKEACQCVGLCVNFLECKLRSGVSMQQPVSRFDFAEAGS